MRVIGWSIVLATAACNGEPGDAAGQVSLAVTAVNSSGLVSPRVKYAAVAPRVLDPASYRVTQFMSGPPDELRVTIVKIFAEASSGDFPSQALYDDPTGTLLTLTNGTLDLGSTIALSPIQVGSYDRLSLWFSRGAHISGCLSGPFDAHTGITGTYAGQSVSNETITAGTHRFCTIESKSELDGLGGGPVGTNAEFEAQATPELVQLDLTPGGRVTADQGPPQTVAEVEAASFVLGLHTPFEITSSGVTRLTVVIDLNRILRFFPNINDAFQPPQLAGLPAGTSYFYTDVFPQSVSLFVGDPGSIEGYEVEAEICQPCPGPVTVIAKEWFTAIRAADGTLIGGFINTDGSSSVIWGDVIAAEVTAGTLAGTIDIPVGIDRVGPVEHHGTIRGFRFKSVGDPEDSCTAEPIGGPLEGNGPFNVWYTRRL